MQATKAAAKDKKRSDAYPGGGRREVAVRLLESPLGKMASLEVANGVRPPGKLESSLFEHRNLRHSNAGNGLTIEVYQETHRTPFSS